jgi:hypothetical protein
LVTSNLRTSEKLLPYSIFVPLTNGLKHIALIFLLFSSEIVVSQSVPWTVRITGDNHTVAIANVMSTANGVNLQAGDVIGVFYDSLGQLACGGYSILEDKTFIIAYGEAFGVPGFKSGEDFEFKVWNRQSNCIYDSVKVDFDTGRAFPNSEKYVSDGFSSVETLNAYTEVDAIRTAYNCQTLKLFVNIPDVSVNWYLKDNLGRIISSEDTLVITESVDYVAEIYSSEICSLTSNISVAFEPYSINNLSADIIDATCYEDGKISFENEIEGGLGLFTFSFRDLLTERKTIFEQVNKRGVITSTTGIDPGDLNLPVGEYELTIIDSAGCPLLYPDRIDIVINENCENIFNPNDLFTNTFRIRESPKSTIDLDSCRNNCKLQQNGMAQTNLEDQ